MSTVNDWPPSKSEFVMDNFVIAQFERHVHDGRSLRHVANIMVNHSVALTARFALQVTWETWCRGVGPQNDKQQSTP